MLEQSWITMAYIAPRRILEPYIAIPLYGRVTCALKGFDGFVRVGMDHAT